MPWRSKAFAFPLWTYPIVGRILNLKFLNQVAWVYVLDGFEPPLIRRHAALMNICKMLISTLRCTNAAKFLTVCYQKCSHSILLRANFPVIRESCFNPSKTMLINHLLKLELILHLMKSLALVISSAPS
jgi:hypothetical protein